MAGYPEPSECLGAGVRLKIILGVRFGSDRFDYSGCGWDRKQIASKSKIPRVLNLERFRLL